MLESLRNKTKERLKERKKEVKVYVDRHVTNFVNSKYGMVEILLNHKKYHSVQIEISYNRWAHYEKLAPRLKVYLIQYI